MVPEKPTRTDVDCNGVTKDFVIEWSFLEDSHLKVLLTVKADPADVTTLQLGVHYTVTGAGLETGGAIHTVATYPDTYRLSVIPNIPFDQLTEYEEGADFPAKSHERALDKLTLLARQLREAIGRAVLGSENYSASYQMPPPEVGKTLGWLPGPVLGNVATDPVSLAADLLNKTSSTKGAGMMGFLYSLAYAAGTVGKALKDLFDADTAMDLRVDACEAGLTAQGYFRSVPVRQTVHAGPMDATGAPTFLPATAVGLSISSQNISGSNPLCVTGALGYDALLQQINTFGRATTIRTWSGLADNATNYLYEIINGDGSLTEGSTTLAPIYQAAGTPSITNGQHTFNWGEMKLYVGNGSVASVVNRVFVGEAVTSGGSVTSTVAYAYNGASESADQAFPGTSTALTLTHNVGAPVTGVGLAVCATTDRGYSPGDAFLSPGVTDTNALSTILGFCFNDKTSTFSTSSVAPYCRPKAGGAVGSMTTANWRVRSRIWRVF